MATNLEFKAQENETLFVVIKTAIVVTVNGSAHQARHPIAIEGHTALW
jgi:hypothetical protein